MTFLKILVAIIIIVIGIAAPIINLTKREDHYIK